MLKEGLTAHRDAVYNVVHTEARMHIQLYLERHFLLLLLLQGLFLCTGLRSWLISLVLLLLLLQNDYSLANDFPRSYISVTRSHRHSAARYPPAVLPVEVAHPLRPSPMSTRPAALPAVWPYALTAHQKICKPVTWQSHAGFGMPVPGTVGHCRWTARQSASSCSTGAGDAARN